MYIPLAVAEEPEGYARAIRYKAAHLANVAILGQLSRREMVALYEQVDCLVCASRDDPMPVVIAEACQYGKVVICSENTGSARLLREYRAGMVYGANDPGALAECIHRCVEGSKELCDMRLRARSLYEEKFSEEAFRASAIPILEDMLGRDVALGNGECGSATRQRERAMRRAAHREMLERSVLFQVARTCRRAIRGVGSAVACEMSFRLGSRRPSKGDR